MAAGGRAGSNGREPIRTVLNGSAAPDPRISALPCAGSLPDVCRIPAGCVVDTGKWFAPSRGCVTQLPGCQTRLPGQVRPTSTTISGLYFRPAFQLTCPFAFHVTSESAGLRSRMTTAAFVCALVRAPLSRQSPEAHPLHMHQSSQKRLPAEAGVAPRASRWSQRSGKPGRRGGPLAALPGDHSTSIVALV
ncbi:hypothetical protein AWB69_04132 [Caballeronia udeis]|uniref:Uncharacterized protein n=1 Tax=Caballeronia udeis TaxID=1232866 RepID=A0A158H9A8_9BURK|nr:hypothetical protein AWB69_04132 [Caballeronia udeis]